MMRRRWIGLLGVATLGFVSVHLCVAGVALCVNEAATRIRLHDDRIEVSLAVENPWGRPLAAHIHLELLDPQDRVRAGVERDQTIPPGSSTTVIPLALAASRLKQEDKRQILWYRMRYRVTPDPSAKVPVEPGEGLLAVAEITSDVFDLHVVGLGYVNEGGRYRARVRATHPVTSRPVVGVAVEAELDLVDLSGSPPLKVAAITDARGFTVVEFPLPRELDSDEFDLKVTARRGNFEETVTDVVQVFHFSQVLLSTDKPIYQPGQVLHVRALAFDTSKQAVAGAPLVFKIHDPEETVVFRTRLETSRFGIASADWPIPENLRLGDYRIQAVFDEGGYEDSGASASVKISRYDLPAFVVSVKPDRTYYLPGQNAEVEVRAAYLFGQPVTRGRARIVRETERRWNYREQKWETKEAEKYEGETDAGSRFFAKIDLAKEHDDLSDEDYSRFGDPSYAAYFTDLTTGRTEQRRFDLRVTKEPIHLYVIQGYGRQAEGFPLEFYVSTFYADGTPAICEVAISTPVKKPQRYGEVVPVTLERPLRTIRTNRYGVAKVSGLAMPEDTESDGLLSFRARDRKGAVSHHTEDFWLSDRPLIRVATDKTLYRAGEPVEVQLMANQPELTVVVDAVREWQVLASRVVRLHKGRAFLVFTPNEKFKDEVSFVAYAVGLRRGDAYDSSVAYGSHTVLFPRDRELKLDVRFFKSTYRPGEEARADFRIRAPGGEAVESALGLVVFDKAVEERARTEREFGSGDGFYGFRRYWGGTEELGGVRRSGLGKLDLSKPLPEGLDLVAEILLQQMDFRPEVSSSDTSEADLRKLFAGLLDPQLKPVTEALTARYTRQGDYPKTETALRSFLADAGIRFDELRDPWATPYRALFYIYRETDKVAITSAGPDKRLGTDDDLTVASMGWSYFRPHADAIQRALNAYHARTGGFTRDAETLKSELRHEGIDFDALRDPWEHPYRLSFGVSRTQFTVSVQSAGPDGRFDLDKERTWDDFTLSTAAIDYFAEARKQIDAALALYLEKTAKFPQNETELREALREAGIELGALRDPWGHPYYVTFRQEARYADRVIVRSYAAHEAAAKQRTETTPVTQQIGLVFLRSAGEDGKEGTSDDFDAAVFSSALMEQSSREKLPQATRTPAVLSGATGAIAGTVNDPTGAVIPGATVTATQKVTQLVFQAKSDDQGKYVLRNLPAGFYQVRFEYPGFRVSVIGDVPVRSSSVTELNARLEVGVLTEAVTVQAAHAPVQTTATSLALARGGPFAMTQSTQLLTPRLREHFPETLLWQPQLVTNGQGRAQVTFPLADNITTWKLAVIASTTDGQLGTAEKEIRAFQPFFVEHDPPRFLTAGDEIALPVVLRNYLDRAQAVNLEMKPGSWFTLLGPAQRRVEVAPRESSRDVFSFRAVAPVKEGKQRITAAGPQVADAIEKKVTVRPDGQERIVMASQVFGEATALEVRIHETAISGALHAELKIYPNLMAHVLESIEGIVQRPYGCAEQAISSAYPSLLVLRYSQRAGRGSSPLAGRAQRYALLGYERLLSYRAPGGGFSYWGRGAADPALTAYALKYLHDAQEFVAMDDSVMKEALNWLINQIREDGSLPWRNWKGEEDPLRTAMQTAYIARVLAVIQPATRSSATESGPAATASRALVRALAYLASRVGKMDEPYLVASYALAALDAGDKSAAAQALERLRRLAHEEAGASYWALETNTPFYGWGLAGRVETTALAVQALARNAEFRSSGNPDEPLVSHGLLFLLRNKDRYGVWYSTQATVNVLNTLLAVISSAETGEHRTSGSPGQAGSPPAEILVNGRRVLFVTLPPADELTSPVAVDLSPFLSPGSNRVEIRRGAGASQATAQLVATYYVPWSRSTLPGDSRIKAGASEALRLAVRFERSEAKTGEDVQCTVEAERIGFRGYGMMLAEIGLPPGAEIDRASLEGAMGGSGWDVSQYDILPDRLIVYLWPRTGGTKFTFSFRPRFALSAQTPPSILYDYYNPEARAIVMPTSFVVR